MTRRIRRLLVAFTLSVVAMGGLIGFTPRGQAPVQPVADVSGAGATPTPAGSPIASQPGASASPAPSVGTPAVAPSPQPTRSPDVTATDPPPVDAALGTLLQSRLERWQKKQGVPGVSAAILLADGSLWTGAAGLADVKAGRPVTADTAFSVASVSKTFTAALILDLAARGRLRLDAAARSYVPDLPIDPAVTIRQLLDHTSGLRDFYLHKGIDKALLGDRSRTWDAAASLAYLGRPIGRPGTSWRYSNSNYLILGLVAEKVGGAPVADQLHARFLDRLGLDDTWYQAVDKPRAPLAHAYRFRGVQPGLRPIDLSDRSTVAPFTSVVTASGAAGSIASTATDLAQWAAALYGGDALEPTARAAMLADVDATARYQPRVPYGLGVQAFDIEGRPALGHSGRFLGARAVARWLPHQHMAIAVVTNQSRTDPARLVADLLDIALAPLPTPTPTCSGCAPAPSSHP